MGNRELLRYKGYSARPEYSVEDRIFYGKVLGIGDLIEFQSENAEDLEGEFHKAVDDYLALCDDMGKKPETEMPPAVRAMYQAGENAKQNGTANMTLEEIDAEIDIVRTERLKRKKKKADVLAWDPDYTKMTPDEQIRVEAAENSGFVNDSDIDWSKIGH